MAAVLVKITPDEFDNFLGERGNERRRELEGEARSLDNSSQRSAMRRQRKAALRLRNEDREYKHYDWLQRRKKEI